MEFGIGLPTAGPDASPDRIARAAEEAERLGLGAVWTFERLLYPEEPMMLGVGPMPLPPANVGCGTRWRCWPSLRRGPAGSGSAPAC
jgi:alkanesulfonate monooxygenase SsuD/methylene tetrahydromethanopterin reductase-like flavin-dependent oxidoreductase (luciferase family)